MQNLRTISVFQFNYTLTVICIQLYGLLQVSDFKASQEIILSITVSWKVSFTYMKFGRLGLSTPEAPKGSWWFMGAAYPIRRKSCQTDVSAFFKRVVPFSAVLMPIEPPTSGLAVYLIVSIQFGENYVKLSSLKAQIIGLAFYLTEQSNLTESTRFYWWVWHRFQR